MVAPIVLAGLLLAAVFAFLFPVIGFVITLPFRILGWVIGLLGWALLLPLILLGALFGVVALVFAALWARVLLHPFVPFALLALGAVWLVRRASHRRRTRDAMLIVLVSFFFLCSA
jgi:hypothetical protein